LDAGVDVTSFLGVKGKGALWLWVGVLVVFLAGAGFVAYKLIKRQKDRAAAAEAQRWEMRSEMKLEGELSADELDQYLASENEKLDRYEVLRPLIDELDLVTFWGVAGPEEAMAKLKDSAELRAGDTPGTVVFVVSDKDKEMTGKLGQALARSYQAMKLRDRMMLPPPPPPGYQE
jgi:hypothetical protein